MNATLTARIALSLCAGLALAAPAVAQPADNFEVRITVETPTTARVDVAGLDKVEARHVIYRAADRVCDAAVRLDQIPLNDQRLCTTAAADKGMWQYRKISTSGAAFASLLVKAT